MAFNEIGITINWEGSGVNEVGKCSETGKILVKIDPAYFRPAEVELLLGDPTRAENELGWKRNISFNELVSCMVQYDLNNDDYGGKE